MSGSDPQPLDVIWLYHGTAAGDTKWRMMVCVSPEDGFYLPINTSDRYRPCFALPRLPHHDWLDHDSHVECDILIFDEYEIERSVFQDGIIGYIDFAHVDDILDGLSRSRIVSSSDRARITEVLTEFRHSNASG